VHVSTSAEQRGYDTPALAAALGITQRQAERLMDSFPQEHLDRLGSSRRGARIAPLWLLRRELSAFRDGPSEEAS
jgi:hypothetical protein